MHLGANPRAITLALSASFAALATLACGSSSDDNGNAPTDGAIDGDATSQQDSTTNGDSTHPPGDAPIDSTHADVPPGDTPHPGDIIDPSRVTQWNPGILTDGQLHAPLGPDGLPVRSTICTSPSPSADLQAAIDGCAEGQVVQLEAGTYTVSATITITKGIVLRGKGAGAGGTTIKKTGGGSVIDIGTSQDQICYKSAFDATSSLAEDATKETTRVHVSSGAASFKAGDLALIDELDDAAVNEGDCPYFKREDHRSTSERVEVASVDAATNVITLTTPLHWTFRSDGAHAGQIAHVSGAVTRYAGVESVLLQGGTNPGYDGQMAGGIDISNAAYCWVKDVQTDDTIAGMHVAMRGTYRCVVRDSYFHNSADYGFGHDCYGVVIACGTADDLVENNIVRYMNKPILFNVSGGGNVVGYNYVDNSWATPPEWQEVNIDTHCAFPHMELVEGNYAPHVGATITHGNAGYLTFFRNYSSGQFAAPPVAGFSGKQTGNMEALQFQKGDVDMTTRPTSSGRASSRTATTTR
jgi:hypothetical protein